MIKIGSVSFYGLFLVSLYLLLENRKNLERLEVPYRLALVLKQGITYVPYKLRSQ